MLSPCIKECKLDINRQYCVSCRRTVEHIVEWRTYTDEERLAIITNLKLSSLKE